MLFKLGFTALILGSVFGYFGMHFYKDNYINKSKVLSFESGENLIAISTSTPTIFLTPTFTPTPTLTPTPINTPTPTSIPQKKFSQQEIHAFIERFAGQYAVDPNVLRHIALCESGFNPFAVNGKYVGLFQFSSNTWKKYRLIIGEDTDLSLRLNAEEATQTAAYAISQGRLDIWPNCRP